MVAKVFKRYISYPGYLEVVGSQGKYKINCYGVVRDTLDNIIHTKRNQKNELIVNILAWDGVRDYRVIDLIAVHFKDIFLPEKYYNEIEAFLANGDKLDIHPSNIGYRFKCGKIEHEDYKGYYYVPGFTKAIINEQGDTYRFSINEWKPVKYGIAKGGAKNAKGGYRVSSTSFDGISTSIRRHRLLALVFLPYPDNVDELDVNHINGVPGDDRLENLEWVTRANNNLHAYINDLKDQHERVLVRNARTGKVNEYYSIAECARNLGFKSILTIWHRIHKAPFSKVFHDGLQMKFKSDPRDWIKPKDVEKEILLAKKNNTLIKVRNVKTDEVTECDTVVDAIKLVEASHKTIIKMIDTGMLFKGYQAKYLDDDSEWPTYTDKEYDLSFCGDNVPIEARNVLTGETNKYISLAEATKVFPKTIIRTLKDGKQQLFANGWQVKYVHDEWKDVKNPEETCYRLNNNVMWIEEATGKMGVADTATNVARVLGWHPGTYSEIREAAYTKGKKAYRGYRFRLGITNDPWPIT